MLCPWSLCSLAIYFIKPLCSARWWTLIQFNTITGVSLKETIRYLSHILWIETNHKSTSTPVDGIIQRCVYTESASIFYVWLMTALSLTPSSFLSASCLGKLIRKPLSLDPGRKFKSYTPLAIHSNPHSPSPLKHLKTSSHFRPSWEPPWPPWKPHYVHNKYFHTVLGCVWCHQSWCLNQNFRQTSISTLCGGL